MSGIRSAFLVFPEEIWDVILEQVEESEDIINVLSAIPQLGFLSEGKQCSWFIGTIIPLIFPKYLEFSSSKLCRQVSKRWRNAVDMTLETHPDRLPFNTKKKKGGVTENHFCYHKLPKIATDFDKYVFSAVAPIFEHGILVTNRTPFPGRCVQFSGKRNLDRERDPFWHNVGRISTRLIALKISGHNIHHFVLDVNAELRFLTRSTTLLYQVFFSLQNLKSLKLTGSFRVNELTAFLDFMSTNTLPFRLDTLDLLELRNVTIGLFKRLVKTFVNRDQLKKFALIANYWDSEFGILFPNLSELVLQENLNNMVKKALQDISTRHFKKLTITVLNLFVVRDILKLVAPHQLESLEICGTLRNAKSKSSRSASSVKQVKKTVTNFFSKRLLAHPDRNNGVVLSAANNFTVPSICSLKLEATPPLSFHFLESLPSLQNLTIEFNNFSQCSNNCQGSFQSGKAKYKFGESLSAFYCNVYHKGNFEEPGNFKDIWEELPNLQMLTIKIVYGHLGKYCRYVRECPNKTFTFSF